MNTLDTDVAPSPALLSTAPDYVRWFAGHGEFDPGERVVGFYALTVPDGPSRVRPDNWAVVTTTTLYTLDPIAELVVGAKVIYHFDD